MTISKSFFALGVFFLFGCSSNLSEIDDTSPIGSGLDLKNIVNLIGQTPADKPSKITEYERENYLYDKFKYYNFDGKELLDVYVDSNTGDTSYFAVYEYAEGILKRKQEFLANAKSDVWQDFEYYYDNTNRLTQITLNGKNFELYSYDEHDRVKRITIGSDLSIADSYEFTYDDQERISTQELKSSIENAPPLRLWTYVYDADGNLLAKQVNDDQGPKDMFIYNYDIQNRLVEIEELYPEYDFISFRKTRFTYP